MNSLTSISFKNRCWVFFLIKEGFWHQTLFVSLTHPDLVLVLSLSSLGHCNSHSPSIILPLALSLLLTLSLTPLPTAPMRTHRATTALPIVLLRARHVAHRVASLASLTPFLFLLLVSSLFLFVARCTLFFYYSFDFDFINNLYVLHEHIYMFTKLFTLSLLGFWLS